MKRNENANCGNCPFWASWTGTGSPDHIGECRQTSVKPNNVACVRVEVREVEG